MGRGPLVERALHEGQVRRRLGALRRRLGALRRKQRPAGLLAVAQLVLGTPHLVDLVLQIAQAGSRRLGLRLGGLRVGRRRRGVGHSGLRQRVRAGRACRQQRRLGDRGRGACLCFLARVLLCRLLHAGLRRHLRRMALRGGCPCLRRQRPLLEGRHCCRAGRHLVAFGVVAGEAVEQAERPVEARAQRLGFLGGDVEAVQPVEPDELVARLQQDRLPALVVGGLGAGPRRLHQDDPWPDPGEIAAGEDALLGAFHVDLEEVDNGRGILLADAGEAAGADDDAVDRPARRAMPLGQHSVEGGQPGALDGVEDLLAFAIVERDLEVDVSRPLRLDLQEVLQARLDVHAMPAAIVEGPGHGMLRRVGGAHVDVEAARDIAEGTHQHDVFAVLRVGDHGHRGIRSGWLRAG